MRSTSPDPAARRRFIAASLVDAVGNGVYVPLTMLFVHDLTGQSLTAIGTGLTLAGLGALAAMPLAGVLIDRHGGKHVYTAALALRAASFALYPLATAYPAFLAVAFAVAVAMWASAPSQQSLIGDMAEGAERDRLLAWNRSLRNGGMGFGALAAAAMLALGDGGYLAAALALAGSFAAAAMIVARIPVQPNRTPRPIARPRGGYRIVLADRRYRRLATANFLIGFGYTAQAIAMPVFLTRDAGLPDATAGVVFAVNTALVAGLGVPVARLMARTRRGRGAALGTAVFALSFGAFAFLPTLDGTAAIIAVLAVAVVYTAGELIHSAPAESLAVHAAPDHLRGRYLSVYQLSWSLCRTLAPMLLGFLLDAGTWQLWVALAAAVLTGGLILLGTDRSPAAPRPLTAPVPATA
ncbi:MFS transporter [Glycomyces algeriensis]|uniref:MFS transporter n=1 Tax=Glycomyces algeriensis TaxID=256037 RepID=A0A9W6LGY7_9ACTN|nr:MFS transporter [Glycomyces algeriensis]MDA1364746.1 MFS transporter [Glycomyces algeriensis]MDR7350787.1 MFS family permease [Glycomyces algeriensis]GLI43497.1 MFS transporter [Glycomyces algeriensis]